MPGDFFKEPTAKKEMTWEDMKQQAMIATKAMGGKIK